MQIQSGGTGGLDPLTPENLQKNIGFLSNSSPDPLQKTKSAFNVGLLMAFSRRPDDGPF